MSVVGRLRSCGLASAAVVLSVALSRYSTQRTMTDKVRLPASLGAGAFKVCGCDLSQRSRQGGMSCRWVQMATFCSLARVSAT